MTDKVSALSRLLLPVQDFDLFRNILPLLEVMSKTMSDELQSVDLLHVVGGSFLSTHLNNIDFRAGHVLSSDLMKRLRRQHHEELVKPLMEKVESLLLERGVGLPVEIRIEDGDPVKKICSICNSEQYSTLIMGRGRKEGDSGIGTVITGVLNRYLDTSVYLVGEDGFPDGKSPVARVMIGIDGSETSLRAAREAALMLSRNGDLVEEVSLVNVRDPSCFFDENGTDCQKASEIGYSYIKEAEKLLVADGVENSKITTMLLFGRPGETLTEYAESFGATMCYIGRRDRMKIAEVLLGSVCGDVMQRCRKTTLVLVS